MKTKKAALVCSGGGALGIAFLGIIEAFQKQGYEFDFYSGVSAGAIVTSLLSIGKTPEEIYKVIEKTNIFRIAFDFSPTNFGFIKGDKALEIFHQLLGERSFSDIESPLFIGSTNFSNGQRVTLSSGSVAHALRASVSVPVLFEPYFHPERKEWLVDGGLSQNLPLDIALEKYQGDEIIALDVSGIDESLDFRDRSFFKKTKSITKTMGRTFKILFQNQQTHFPNDSRVRHFRLTLSDFDSTDIFQIKEIYEWGCQYGQNLLENDALAEKKKNLTKTK